MAVVKKNALISLRDVGKTYRIGQTAVNALGGIDLEIACGEQVAVIGPSGSGKSTLMNIIGILDSPSEGSFYFDGTDIGSLRLDEKAQIRSQAVGFVFQQFHLIAHLTAGQNVELPLRYQNVSRAERDSRVSSCLDAVGLSHRRDHRPHQLSGGERQRVAIARALVAQPKLILADEPTGALDSVNGQAVIQLMMSLSTEMGVTLVLITHDPSLAKLFPRCISLLDGSMKSDIQTHNPPAAQALAVC